MIACCWNDEHVSKDIMSHPEVSLFGGLGQERSLDVVKTADAPAEDQGEIVGRSSSVMAKVGLSCKYLGCLSPSVLIRGICL
jgi:hypothetical protein